MADENNVPQDEAVEAAPAAADEANPSEAAAPAPGAE